MFPLPMTCWLRSRNVCLIFVLFWLLLLSAKILKGKDLEGIVIRMDGSLSPFSPQFNCKDTNNN